jgi:hypothetical protein
MKQEHYNVGAVVLRPKKWCGSASSQYMEFKELTTMRFRNSSGLGKTAHLSILLKKSSPAATHVKQRSLCTLCTQRLPTWACFWRNHHQRPLRMSSRGHCVHGVHLRQMTLILHKHCSFVTVKSRDHNWIALFDNINIYDVRSGFAPCCIWRHFRFLAIWSCHVLSGSNWPERWKNNIF